MIITRSQWILNIPWRRLSRYDSAEPSFWIMALTVTDEQGYEKVASKRAKGKVIVKVCD